MNDPLILTIIILSMVALLMLFSRLNTSQSISRRKNSILKTLEELKSHIESDNEYERKDAIIRLDNLLAKALNYRYRNSLSCGDNLKKAGKLFRKDTYQSLWDAHKLRNEIVHKDEVITIEQAKKSYHIYKLCISRIVK